MVCTSVQFGQCRRRESMKLKSDAMETIELIFLVDVQSYARGVEAMVIQRHVTCRFWGQA
jgi:hypothetical protein